MIIIIDTDALLTIVLLFLSQIRISALNDDVGKDADNDGLTVEKRTKEAQVRRHICWLLQTIV